MLKVEQGLRLLLFQVPKYLALLTLSLFTANPQETMSPPGTLALRNLVLPEWWKQGDLSGLLSSSHAFGVFSGSF